MKELFLRQVDNPDSFTFESVGCYQCGADDYEFFLIGEDDLTGREGNFQFVKCRQCDLVYQQPRLSIENVKLFYDEAYIAHRKERSYGPLTPLVNWAMDRHDRDKERIVRRFTDLNEHSEVLDVGCAVGTFLLYLNKKRGCHIAGVDFKEDLDFPGFEKVDFYGGLFYEQQMEEERFDLVTMWHFLEHDYDPGRSLEMAGKVLKKGGKLVIEVPRLDSFSFRLFGKKWPGVQAPQHTVMFSRKSLTKLVESQGFRIVEYLPYGAFPRFFYFFAGAYFRVAGKGLKLKRVLFLYTVLEIIFTPVLLFHRYLNLSMQTIICEKKEITTLKQEDN